MRARGTACRSWHDSGSHNILCIEEAASLRVLRQESVGPFLRALVHIARADVELAAYFVRHGVRPSRARYAGFLGLLAERSRAVVRVE